VNLQGAKVIFCDPREGSETLVEPLRATGIPVDDSVELPGGDLYFVGRGHKGEPVEVGIEYKKLPDLISSIKSERLQGHQLLEMRGTSEDQPKPLYDVAWLLIEGKLEYGADGMLMRRAGVNKFKPLYMNIHELYKRLNVMQYSAGLFYVFTGSKRESVQWITAQYHTWTDVNLDQHKSHLAVYNAPTLVKPTKFCKSVRTFPHVGDRVAKAAESKFRTIKRAVNAAASEWAELATVDEKGKTRRFGSSHAEAIVKHVN
jgi:ERCC4-type nuclease